MHGFVKDEDGQPINGARISVNNRRHDVFSARDGDFWRLLVPGSYEITVSGRGFEQETKSCTVLVNKAAQLDFTLKKIRMRESKQTIDDYNWPRERILNDDVYRSEQGRQAWENRGYNEEKVNDDYNDAVMRREYNIREYRSEQGRQAWENRGYNEEKVNDDYNDAVMRREYNIRENRGSSYEEYGQKRNSFPHPK